MLLYSKDAISASTSEAITRTMLALDPFAQVRVDAPKQQVNVNGQLTPQQVVAALDSAGCSAGLVEESELVQVQGGSTCCGSCS